MPQVAMAAVVMVAMLASAGMAPMVLLVPMEFYLAKLVVTVRTAAAVATAEPGALLALPWVLVRLA